MTRGSTINFAILKKYQRTISKTAKVRFRITTIDSWLYGDQLVVLINRLILEIIYIPTGLK